MDFDEFREFGHASIEFIINYLSGIRERDVLPSVAPYTVINQLPKEIPEKPEHWREVLKDLESIILPGLTHWQSPYFNAFYPSSSSAGSIVGELLIAGIGVLGFSWICSPACTELEVVVMDWLAKFLKLPEHFQHASDGPGGGVIQGSASEAVLVAVLAAREQAVISCKETHPELSESEVRGKLIAYSSDQSNSCIEKAGVLAAMPIKLLPADDDLILRGNTLRKAIEDDVAAGLIPVICIATLGTTGTCAYDDIDSLADVCQALNVWLHVDAAYAGGGFALEECTELRRGLDRVDSLNFNLHKFMLVNFDCSAMWLKDANKVVDSFNVDRIYLKHKHEGQSQIPDFRHWQIPLGRRFRALKVWITFRTLGAEGLRSHVRKHIALAQQFEAFVRNDSRFEMVAPQALGLVCFRPRGDNEHTAQLLQRLMERKKIYMVKAEHAGRQFLRFAVCGMDAKPSDIEFAWTEIETQLTALLAEKSLAARKPSNVSELTQHFQMHLASDSGTHEKSQ
ncbi:alpha-methyldopa hypersensitive protein isoform X1 [Drosophila persimilis]|uniref:3,4-dihydroxyphenylacetaldehyde synthase 2 isoform X1 n=1 Tax=Drosophila pseudoobscura pseudoobscura TaxID=46245 RepID=Q29K30_DROPS|nr:3,4-dihydroxyphenylacetaldehyde synthase 2 isoform X1 [Drosophila pseudoobscura]XP_026843593.1 alpha-methyldopa hypersensitive protein isoform X1 [Drosophila persimilis]